MVKYPEGNGTQKSRRATTFFFFAIPGSGQNQKTCLFARSILAKKTSTHFETLSITSVTSTQESPVKGISKKVKGLCCWPAEPLPVSWTGNPEAKMLMMLPHFAYLNKQDT